MWTASDWSPPLSGHAGQNPELPGHDQVICETTDATPSAESYLPATPPLWTFQSENFSIKLLQVDRFSILWPFGTPLDFSPLELCKDQVFRTKITSLNEICGSVTSKMLENTEDATKYRLYLFKCYRWSSCGNLFCLQLYKTSFLIKPTVSCYIV
jgi:hypothetical protein